MSSQPLQRTPPRFEPERHRSQIEAIIAEIASRGAPIDSRKLDAILRRYPRDGRGFFSRSQLIEGYRHLYGRTRAPLGEAEFVAALQLRPVRTRSGVTPLTVLTKPFPCPGRCVFCPNDVRMPKSYLSAEPGAQRAASNRFDPYLQTWNRLSAFRAMGHPTDKVELIVLGGTWSAYPEPYQVWFARRCFDAMNDFGEGRDGRSRVKTLLPDRETLPAQVAGRDLAPGAYNRHVTAWLAAADETSDEEAEWKALAAAQRANEGAASRCVGLVVETRPDYVNAMEVRRIRRLGGTKVQLGVQSLSDEILRANQRGHDVAASHAAIAQLRGAGFKIHTHWMPNLLGATPESDARDFERLFDDPAVRPDELKIYPCSLVESAELVRHYESGAWRPYEHDELLELLATVLPRVPRWCRVTRVIRDISSDDILVGNKLTNFREIAEAEVRRRGHRLRDIRSREIRAEPFDPAALEWRTTGYATATGRERFLEVVTAEDRLVGFLRLSLPGTASGAGAPAELCGSAVIREVHVYGASLPLGARDEAVAQHRGLGARLVETAAAEARAAGFGRLAVISAVGTRPWYRRLGFADGDLYQHRGL